MRKHSHILIALLLVIMAVVCITPQGCSAPRDAKDKEAVMPADERKITRVKYSQAHMRYPNCFKFKITASDKTGGLIFSAACADVKGVMGDRVSFEDVQVDGSTFERIAAIVKKHNVEALHRLSAKNKLNDLKEAARKKFLILNDVKDYTSTSLEITFDDGFIINHNNESPGMGDAMKEIRSYLETLASDIARKTKK